MGRDDDLLQLNEAGIPTGLSNVSRGRNLDIKPYVLAGAEEDNGIGNWLFKFGFYVRYPLTSDLTLDMTMFTDFAQIEAD